jgi:uncharacterized protein (TIGR03435 family)
MNAYCFLVACLALAADTFPRFEAATVRPTERIPSNGSFLSRGGPGTQDPERIMMSPVSLRRLIALAYDVPEIFRLEGPEWMGDAYYELNAKLAPKATREEYRLMLQDLLKERFALRVHRQVKSVPGFELRIAKRGPKLLPSDTRPDPEYEKAPPSVLLRMADGHGQLQLRPGRKGRVNVGLPGGLVRISARQQEIGDIAEMCASVLFAPVVNGTSLSGTYDFNLDYWRDGGSGSNTGQANSDSSIVRETPGPRFLAALEEQLGLRLVARKLPTDVLIVDSASKIPLEQ